MVWLLPLLAVCALGFLASMAMSLRATQRHIVELHDIRIILENDYRIRVQRNAGRKRYERTTN